MHAGKRRRELPQEFKTWFRTLQQGNDSEDQPENRERGKHTETNWRNYVPRGLQEESELIAHVDVGICDIG